LEKSPVVKAGQRAPEWKVAKWLDGKEHSLKEFRGKIVVLSFAASTGSGSEHMAPVAATVQEKFKDKPIVFVTIYLAEHNVAEAAKRAAEFASKHKLTALAAIDAGTMPENSQTNHAYGINLGLPAEVIIGPDGIVQYNEMEPEPGLEGILGKDCDEATPEDMAKMEAYMKRLVVEAGERWPVAPENMNEEESTALMNRVNVFHLSKRIDAALKAAEKTERR
jgi:thiol-disulfide isomerase/thioredoxin